MKCLFPYRYHDWMKSEDLQRLTASEPLFLEEEYEMQKNWRNDDDSNYSCFKTNEYLHLFKLLLGYNR